MRKFKVLLVTLITVFCLAGCSSKSLNIFITSDIHYFSKSLHDEGELYTNSLKQTLMYVERSVEIFDEFVEVCKNKAPQYLIIAGDLTFNGELKSLEDLSVKLKEIEESGVKVLVIPGNHDMYYNNAHTFSGNTYGDATTITDEDYLELMADFGYNQAIFKDEYTFSYVYELDKDNYVLMLDANHIGTRGFISPKTIEFVDEVMPKLADKHVFAVSHQPIIKPFDQDYFGYNVYNDREVMRLLQKHGIKELYVGHIHSERDKTVDGLHQQTVTSLLVDDVKYSTIKIKNGVHEFSSHNFSSYENEAMNKRELFMEKLNS